MVYSVGSDEIRRVFRYELADFLADSRQRFRVLGGVRMIRPRVDLQLLDHLICQLVLGQHPANGMVNQIFWLSLLAITIAFKLQAWVPGVPRVVASVHFLAGHRDFFRVGDDDEIATINVRSVLRAVLAHQNDGDVAS